jgi:hypothetical protein
MKMISGEAKELLIGVNADGLNREKPRAWNGKALSI